MTREMVDGMDVLAVCAAMDRAVVRAATATSPTLLEIRTYRFMGHSMSDPIHGHYRTKEEVEAHRKRDPIHLWSEKLIADGLHDAESDRRRWTPRSSAEVAGRLRLRGRGARPGPSSSTRRVCPDGSGSSERERSSAADVPLPAPGSLLAGEVPSHAVTPIATR